jgi:hypothetical protein
MGHLTTTRCRARVPAASAPTGATLTGCSIGYNERLTMSDQLQVVAEETSEGKRVVVTFTPVEAVEVEQERGY